MEPLGDEAAALRHFQEKLLQTFINSTTDDTLPRSDAVTTAENAILQELPSHGKGVEFAIDNLRTLSQGFNSSSQSPHYYGFVTGGATRIASAADTMATVYDQNVQVHLPSETVATTLESHALRMLCQLLRIPLQVFNHRIFTTGATASNILGLACGREYVIAQAAARRGLAVSTGEKGIRKAMEAAGLDDIQVLTSAPHSSLGKAASVVGLGRDSVISVAQADSQHMIDFDKLEAMLRKPRIASIVAISCGEVNTGFFATDGDEMKRIRSLCDEVGAFIHVDGAFGMMARCLIEHPANNNIQAQDLEHIIAGCEGLEYADSITGDGHKLLNVPYDCGFFFSRSIELATEVFQNAGAAYLNVAPAEPGSLFVPSPLNIGLENSRRFRALPVYASLVAYGHDGYADMLLRQIELAKGVARAIAESESYELLPAAHHEQGAFRDIYIVVLFRARDDKLNMELVRRINQTRKIYVSGTRWEGRPAARIAVSNWQADPRRDLALIRDVLHGVSVQWASDRGLAQHRT